MGRKQWLNVTIMITINFLTPARDLKSSDADERGGPDLPVLPAGQESANHLLVSTAHSGSSATVQPDWR